MLSNNIKPKYWKWAEGKVFGIKYLQKFGPLGYGGFSLNEWDELRQTRLVEQQNELKLTREAFSIILDRIENETLALSAPLKFCSKEELRRIALRNEFNICQGWGPYWQEDYLFLKRTYLPRQSCKHGYLYWLHSRNLRYGIYNEESDGFIGIRTKFGNKYLFTEYHWDIGEPFGTVKPLKRLNKTTFNVSENNVKLFDYLAELPELNISLENYLD